MRIRFFRQAENAAPDTPPKSRLAKFFLIYAMRFWKLIALNTLYVLLCVPLVTAGPATVAMAYVLRLYSEEKLVYVWADFWRMFRSCFTKGLILFLCCAAVEGATGYASYFYLLLALTDPIYFIPFMCAFVALLVSLAAGVYAAMLLGSVEITLPQAIRNALLLSIAEPGRSLGALLCWPIGAAFTALLFPASLLLVLLLLPVTVWYACVFLLDPVIKKRCVMPCA